MGVHLLLAHEFPSALGDTEARRACNFNDFWNDGWTPRWLLSGDSNVYRQIANALKGGAWRAAGLLSLRWSWQRRILQGIDGGRSRTSPGIIRRGSSSSSGVDRWSLPNFRWRRVVEGLVYESIRRP